MQAEKPKAAGKTMKAVRIHGFGGPDVLRCEDAPKPQAGTGDIVVQVKAAGVNPIDWKIRGGYMKELFQKKLPLILGVDVAGIVEETGDSVKNYKKGDAVYSYLGSMNDGGYAQYVAADASAIAPKPEKADFLQAAALPLVSLVGWQTLFDYAGLQPGQTVLVHGAAGGVGHMAVQLAKWKGARVIGTASARNADFVKGLGADQVIDYHAARFEDAVQDADVVLDTQAGDTQRRSYKVLKKGGILISTLGIQDPGLAEKYGVRASGFMAQPDGGELQQIARLVDEGKVKPEINRVMPLKEAAKAHEMSETGHVRGKIVLKVSD